MEVSALTSDFEDNDEFIFTIWTSRRLRTPKCRLSPRRLFPRLRTLIRKNTLKDVSSPSYSNFKVC